VSVRRPNIRDVLSDPIQHWQHAPVPAGSAARPVIAISRQHGARGGELARLLARELDLHVYDREIIQRIAESAHLSERAVAILDEKDGSTLNDWLLSLSNGYLSPYGYREHLVRAVAAIGRLGGAVVLGRGGHLILGPGEALRVLVVAPLEARVREIGARDGVDAREAERRIAAAEADRAAFLKRHFHSDFGDPCRFDLVVNTGALGLDGAFDAVCGALHRAPALVR
jgi:CMP/dCMP kinase